jgi:(S)-2-hydroxyglutarate dehydrogenase
MNADAGQSGKPGGQVQTVITPQEIDLREIDLRDRGSQLTDSQHRNFHEEELHDVVIVGGGIVGLATGFHLATGSQRRRVLVLEKESVIGSHQTGNNSGVIHSGLYYKPGSLKARMATAGAESMVRFCQDHAVAHEVTGKLVVATKPSELAQLDDLYRRGIENGLSPSKLSPEQAREHEPHVAVLEALWVPSTGIADYSGVCRVFAEQIREHDGDVRLATKVEKITTIGNEHRISTTTGDIRARFVINCAGLYSDKVARSAGADPTAQIVPFRGEYFELVPHRRHLVKGLIYPVPNPDFPFLGVHFTRMIDGSVHAGPNAVLAFQREGYRKRDIDLRELGEILSYPGFHRLAVKNWREGASEMWRSFSRAAFVRSLQSLIPEITKDDVIPTHAGVRAQALKRDGSMVEDFLIVEGDRMLHVCNAPSPAATASLEIGLEIANRANHMTPAPRKATSL